jgi:tetratricopeptide (TPR) repeat protein
MPYGAAMTRRAIPLLAALLLATPAAFAAQVPKAAKSPKPAKVEAPLSPDSLVSQARAATVRGDTDLALRLAQSAIVADPARPASYVALGDIYAAMGQSEFARSYYQAALSIEPLDAGAKKALAALDSHTATTANAH